MITSKLLMRERSRPCTVIDKVADGGFEQLVNERRAERNSHESVCPVARTYFRYRLSLSFAGLGEVECTNLIKSSACLRTSTSCLA